MFIRREGADGERTPSWLERLSNGQSILLIGLIAISIGCLALVVTLIDDSFAFRATPYVIFGIPAGVIVSIIGLVKIWRQRSKGSPEI